MICINHKNGGSSEFGLIKNKAWPSLRYGITLLTASAAHGPNEMFLLNFCTTSVSASALRCILGVSSAVPGKEHYYETN